LPVLEAMACGTIILVTPVGAVPDIIKNGINGFILQNNSPDIIAKRILDVLDKKGLQQISNNGRTTIENNYTYEIAVKRFKHILEKI